MSEFEELLEKIQEQKPELTKQDIEDRIKQKKEKLQYGNYHITITDPYNFNGDKNRYSTEILFWGRRGGKTFYQMCKETPIEQEYTDQLKPAPKWLPAFIPSYDLKSDLAKTDFMFLEILDSLNVNKS